MARGNRRERAEEREHEREQLLAQEARDLTQQCAAFAELPEATQQRIAERLIETAIERFGRIRLYVLAERRPPFPCEWHHKKLWGIGFDLDDPRAVAWALEALRCGYHVRFAARKYFTGHSGPDFVDGRYQLREQ
jgi:hypothetical protein